MRYWRITYQTRCGAERQEETVLPGYPPRQHLVPLSPRQSAIRAADPAEYVPIDVRRYALYDLDSLRGTATYRETG